MKQMFLRFAEFILSNTKIYAGAMKCISRQDGNIFLASLIAAKPGQRILDIGCGPSTILDYLPEVEYTGIDMSEKYIRDARKRFGDRATFHCADINDLPQLDGQKFDRILLFGVQHHLPDDQLTSLMNKIPSLLATQGRVITHDPVFMVKQNPIAKFLAKRDRGQYVRFQSEYQKLIPVSLIIESFHVKTDLLRLPYSILFQDIRIKNL